MQQSAETSAAIYQGRIAKVQKAMKEFGLEAVVLEPGPAMLWLTGVRWGKSERTFVVVLPAKGDPVWVLPGFEEMRARELIRQGFHIIAGSNDGAVCVFERQNNIGCLLWLRRMQPVPALNSQGFPSEFGVAGHAPDVGLDVVLLG